jgi:trans-aconitate 2-methyltransferase
VGTSWEASVYDCVSQPQQSWATDVLDRVGQPAGDAAALDVGCGTGRVTERLAQLIPDGRLLAIDASPAMADLARERLGERAEVLCLDVLDLELDAEVDLVFSTATLHWVRDHDRLWQVLARALRAGGRLEVQCGGAGNIARVREAIAAAAEELAPELVGFSPWTFASPSETEARLTKAGFEPIRCWLEDRPTHPQDPAAFVRSSILAAHLERLPAERREQFSDAVIARVELPLDYVRLNVSAVRAGPPRAGRRAAS